MLQCGTTTNEQLKIELLSQWNLEAEFRNFGQTKNRWIGVIKVPDPESSSLLWLPGHQRSPQRIKAKSFRDDRKAGIQIFQVIVLVDFD